VAYLWGEVPAQFLGAGEGGVHLPLTVTLGVITQLEAIGCQDILRETLTLHRHRHRHREREREREREMVTFLLFRERALIEHCWLLIGVEPVSPAYLPQVSYCRCVSPGVLCVQAILPILVDDE